MIADRISYCNFASAESLECIPCQKHGNIMGLLDEQTCQRHSIAAVVSCSTNNYNFRFAGSGKPIVNSMKSTTSSIFHQHGDGMPISSIKKVSNARDWAVVKTGCITLLAE